MKTNHGETETADYLIVGTGAVGMAFADTLLCETDATITMVDRFHKPGGHWNVAYPFVTLHQPSAFYGVSSRELSSGHLDVGGLNDGLAHLATGAEVSAYFDAVMRERFVPSGRVSYHPMCEYTGEGRFESKLTGQQHQVEVTGKIVDCTYLNTTVPSTHTPNFSIADGVTFMPLNDLPTITTRPAGYVVIGGGKTGIDACLWLLENGVDPDDIRWIVSRDAWLLNRINTQPGEEFFHNTIETQAAQFEAITNSTSVEDMFDRLEACGYFVRIDEDVRPTMFHGATISTLELEELRRITNIVRLGRVTSIELDSIVFEEGTIPTTPNHVHVDCSASALSPKLESKPVFEPGLITPQMVRAYQPVFSASVIARVEATGEDDEKKNSLCAVVPLPNHDTDYLRLTFAGMMNQYNWSQEPGMAEWLAANRLDGFSGLIGGIGDDVNKKAVMKRLSANAVPAVTKLAEYIAELPDDRR